jgi:hypothetical protein
MKKRLLILALAAGLLVGCESMKVRPYIRNSDELLEPTWRDYYIGLEASGQF